MTRLAAFQIDEVVAGAKLKVPNEVAHAAEDQWEELPPMFVSVGPEHSSARPESISAGEPAHAVAPRAAAVDSPARVLDEAFALLPSVFIPAKVIGWTANIHFDLAGSSPWTVRVAHGACVTVRGLDGVTTCVVRAEARTWADILLGKERAEKAFMDGRITASSLSDMLKFGTAFDMRRVQAILEAENTPVGPAAALTPTEIVGRAFSTMPEVFVADKAKGWTANVQFEVQGAGDWSVMIADGRCRVANSREGTATCVVKTDAKTWADVMAGNERAEKAFLDSKITASNMNDLMKFGAAFNLKRLAQLVASNAVAPVVTA